MKPAPVAVPMPFQEDGIAAINRFNGRVILADEMGLGKTCQALWWIAEEPDVRLPAVVVCPATLKINWEREAASKANIRAQVLEGRVPPSAGLIRPKNLLVINYEILKGWLPYLKGLGVQTVIIDESQRIQNRQALCTKMVTSLCKHVPHVLALSGTPLTNRPSELYPTLNIVCPGLFPNWSSYAQRHCRPRLTPWGWVYDGASRLVELHNTLIQNGMIRRLKRDVMQDLPAKVRRMVTLPLYDPNHEYKKAETDFLEWLKTISVEKAKRASKAEKLTQIGYLKRLAAKLKLRPALEWVDHWLSEYPDKKIVLFGVHTKLIDALRRRYVGRIVHCVGDMSATEKQAAVDAFQHDPTIRVFAGNIQAAGVGLTLTAADTVAFLELDWRPALLQQAEARIDRIGQLYSTTMWYLIAAGTIEELLCGVLQDKSEVTTTILDGDEREDRDVLDILDTLIEGLGQKLVLSA